MVPAALLKSRGQAVGPARSKHSVINAMPTAFGSRDHCQTAREIQSDNWRSRSLRRSAITTGGRTRYVDRSTIRRPVDDLVYSCGRDIVAVSIGRERARARFQRLINDVNPGIELDALYARSAACSSINHMAALARRPHDRIKYLQFAIS